MKILSPAGNFQSLKLAVYNGANEVYLGVNEFNARNNIDGFTIQTLKEAVDFAHLYGVKVDLAVNILFTNEEIQSALDLVVDAYNLGVDAFIVQDLGLAKIIHDNYPQIELHASTQMGIHNLEGVKNITQFGFTRVVLARETPLEEIKRIRDNSNIEIEFFVQGALCVSFSGNCYLSSYMLNASGNRGRCKQLCRLPFSLQYKEKTLKKGYLLSAKDFNLINRLKELKNVGVDVVKIEGRARRAEYVGLVTNEYRKALDGLNFSENNIKLAFNREYTPAYFDGNGLIISDFNNHIGIKVGKVLKINVGKKFNQVFISSNRKLSAKSTLKFFANKKEINTVSIYDLKELSQNKYVFTTTQNIFLNADVHLLTDYELENNLAKAIVRVPIELTISAIENKPIKAIYRLNNVEYEILGEVCLQAKNKPLTINQINDNFSKSEYFDARVNISRLDLVFLTLKDLNEFRRKVFISIFENLTKLKTQPIKKIKINTPTNSSFEFSDLEVIDDINSVVHAKNIIYSPETYDLSLVEEFIKKCKINNKNPYLDLPNFALEKDIQILKNIILRTDIAIIANNYYALNLTPKTVIGMALNVYNDFTASIFNLPYIKAENSSSNYKFPYMTLRHCPMKSHLNSSCSLCAYKNGFTYKMDNGKILKLKRKKITTCIFYLTD